MKAIELIEQVRGTAFQKQVWRALCTIPCGETRTYSDIARQIGQPRAVRAVAHAIHCNPWPIIVPCHRVVGKHTIGGYAYGIAIKQQLLAWERK